MDFKRHLTKNPVVVAPMAGISNKAFRLLAQEMGAGLVYTEMISDKGLKYGSVRTRRMTEILPEEENVVLQLFGADEEALAYATEYVDKHTRAVAIDLNLGCPVPKVVKNNGGVSLMRHPEQVGRLISLMCERTDLPITVKMRSGWDEANKNAVEIARVSEAAGVSLIAVHGRTRTQMYRGEVDLDIIRAVKEAVEVPVLANGDVKTPEDALDMMDVTGCDGVMVGRALLGNPWLIRQCNDYLCYGRYDESPSVEERVEMAKRHAALLAKHYGERRAALEMRSQAPWYLKGLPDSSQARKALSRADSRETMSAILDDYLSRMKTAP